MKLPSVRAAESGGEGVGGRGGGLDGNTFKAANKNRSNHTPIKRKVQSKIANSSKIKRNLFGKAKRERKGEGDCKRGSCRIVPRNFPKQTDNHGNPTHVIRGYSGGGGGGGGGGSEEKWATPYLGDHVSAGSGSFK